MLSIVNKFLGQLEGYVAGRHINLSWSNELKAFLEKDGFDAAMGARPLARLINERVKLPLSNFMMDNPTVKDISVGYSIKSDKVVVKEKVQALGNDPQPAEA